MKYTLEGFNQAKLVALSLDVTDACILRWFVDFRATGRMKPIQVDGETYYWVKYQAIIDDLPALGIANCKSISRRMMKLVEAGVLNRHVEKHGGGTFTCFRVGDELVCLLAHPGDSNATQGTQMSGATVPKRPLPGDSNVHPKDSSTRDSSTRDQDIVEAVVSTTTPESSNSIPYVKIIGFLNQEVGTNFKHAAEGTRRLIQARWREGFREEDFRKVIEIKANQWRGDPKMTKYLRPITLFSNKFEGYRQEGQMLLVDRRMLRTRCRRPGCGKEFEGQACDQCGWSEDMEYDVQESRV